MFDKYCSHCKQKIPKNQNKCNNCHPITKKETEERHRRKAELVNSLTAQIAVSNNNLLLLINQL